MGLFFTVFYFILMLRQSGEITLPMIIELAAGYAFFVLFYYLFGRYVRPLIKPKE